jgi:2-dehydro-3-deoxyglucarate aldolase/4-hydroxy-2-oxoheptanedioate aldolase
MHTNRVKQALKAGKVQLGAGFWQLRSAEIPRLLAGAGFDWIFLDTEHGGFDLETVQDLCRVANISGIAPIVRVGDMQYSLVARALDCGAQGIIFPRVESPELLAQAVSWTKFPPQGVRGFGLSTAQLGYGKVTFPEAIEHTNANTMVVLQIETVRAFEARNELLSVPGIDAVLIGPSDLSISLGIPGEYENSRVVKTMEGIRDSCLEHNVAPGTHTRSSALARFWKERGMLFLSCGNELAYLYEKALEVVHQLKDS